ncbi:hypothetical protein GE09DRAFT_1050579 [Coniochaeta sp. 2T2.1]|nr:hypothetical protein GE09DRAFT_1050579 [Coniochaeta sp. 2T2.1]
MEGLTAVALAGNVLQFIEFALKFTSRVAQIYQKADDEKANRVQLQNMLNDFILVAAKLESKTTTTPHSGTPNAISRPIAVQAKNEKVEETMRMLAGHSVVLGHYASSAPESPVERLARSCKVTADSLLHRLEKLRVVEERGSGRIWNSVKAALQEMWKQSELDELRQVDQFQASNLVMNKILEVMQTHQPQVTKPYIDGIASRMSQEHSTTREEIKDAVMEAISSLGLRDASFNIGLLNSHDVLRAYARDYSRSLLDEEREILGSLKYPVMLDREDDISTAQKETFSWIFQDPKPDDLPWSNFRAWLNGDDRLYWITGKAGSGKSTLMKYLFCHARTRREILAWATPAQPFVIAGFFFWNTGSPMQKTQQGLFRSLVYQILSHHRELMPLIRHDIGYRAGYNKRSEGLSDSVWTNSLLERVFRTLVTQIVKPIKVFLFIDGLDEYSGSHGDITKLLKDISTTKNVKICVSSRPYIAFQNAFGKCPSLILQNLTHRDIKTYVTAKFNEDPQNG